MQDYRIGVGFDLHRFSSGKKYLMLGGYRLDCGFGLEAVSDGDVVLHAAADALCGAACLGDIGDYFRPRQKKNKNLNSRIIAGDILKKIENRYELVNMDITLITEKPKLFAYKKKITGSLQSIFEIESVNLKIKSKEKTQILGGNDAFSCLAAVLVRKIKKK